MKKILLSMAVFCSMFYFGQEKDLNLQIDQISKNAFNAYESKDYLVAAKKYSELYNILKENKAEDKIYLYYSGLSFALAEKYDEAIKIYSDLINSGFTGIETKYTARDKSGNVHVFNKSIWEALKKGSKEYVDYRSELTPGVEKDMYETFSSVLLTSNRAEEALKVIDKGLAKFPNSSKLKENQSSALFASGKNDEFEKSLKDLIEKNPNDAVNWYNLGVMQSKYNSKEAIESFKKAILLEPKMENAHMNLVYTLVGNDEKEVNEINNLRKSNKMDEATDKIESRRARFESAIPYAEAWLNVNPKSIEAVQTLKSLYGVTKDHLKAKQMSEKEAELTK